jgi:hypothetical protein
MKKQVNEPDFIGGQGALTKEEEAALTQYFAKKKSRVSKHPGDRSTKKRPRAKVPA